jgi:hypothetical protein
MMDALPLTEPSSLNMVDFIRQPPEIPRAISGDGRTDLRDRGWATASSSLITAKALWLNTARSSATLLRVNRSFLYIVASTP